MQENLVKLETIEVLTHIAHNLMQDFVGQLIEIHPSLGFLHRLSVRLTDKCPRLPGNELLEYYTLTVCSTAQVLRS